MNKEYEYSFKVEDLSPFFDYCKNNNFVLTEKFEQSRTLYKHPNKTMARITINKCNNKEIKLLDFKEDKLVANEVLKEAKESMPVEFEDDSAIQSILDFLNYKEDVTLHRTRTTYEKGNVKFEFDEYISPEKAKVVAIEGEKDLVDKIYLEIKDLK